MKPLTSKSLYVYICLAFKLINLYEKPPTSNTHPIPSKQKAIELLCSWEWGAKNPAFWEKPWKFEMIIWVVSIHGSTPKMDGWTHGKSENEMDDLGYPHDLGNLHYPFSQKRVHSVSTQTVLTFQDHARQCQVVK